jgi:hypothetical protein
MKNFICTAEGFVKSAGFSQDEQSFVIAYTEKVREAQQFNTKAALKFMENHGIMGFVWKPYKEDPIRDMYYVKKVRMAWQEDDDEKINEWRPVKAIMASDSDISFLRSKKLTEDDVMTYEEAKAEALRLNMEMAEELTTKIQNLSVAEKPKQKL